MRNVNTSSEYLTNKPQENNLRLWEFLETEKLYDLCSFKIKVS